MINFIVNKKISDWVDFWKEKKKDLRVERVWKGIQHW
jgi:hypothetical protein